MISKNELLKEFSIGNKLDTLLEKADERVRFEAKRGKRNAFFGPNTMYGILEENAVKAFIQLGYDVQVERYYDGQYSITLYW